MPRHPPCATITWPLQIIRCSRTLFTNQNTDHKPGHLTPETNHHRSAREFSRVVAGTNPTRDCFLRHPTARPLMLLATRGQVRFHFSHSRTGCKQPTGPLSSPTDDRKISACKRLLRKEVIQPHLPVRLPCYDFVPIASPTFDHSPRKTGWAMGFGCYRLS